MDANGLSHLALCQTKGLTSLEYREPVIRHFKQTWEHAEVSLFDGKQSQQGSYNML